MNSRLPHLVLDSLPRPPGRTEEVDPLKGSEKLPHGSIGYYSGFYLLDPPWGVGKGSRRFYAPPSRDSTV